ncbi:MAG: bifunctional diaminohydroxyphosphoribosylaminopyrimidine deaminase/5-amino-6-(5-phosphoribosylamino)uracil reductase RibD [Alphaproteobacteria bacterium]|nr:bifunctional diaminohydroxyphosphoribosylaminopyrimidine deaminase/5-amino-6-(5-phosphoribosylamino)uracil reductase RibD [Alphaproteobacteria bacterium]
MRAALGLARRGLGRVAPNPSVACIILKDGRVVARGRTGEGGRPHGEAVALAQAGSEARGATAVVTLEPCAHHGKTPPCADALATAGIARVVSTIRDPDPRVAGQGFDRLRAAGIEVVEGVEAAAAVELNLGFLTRARLGRPAVTLKLATTLDGRIATRTGESRWITGEAARREAHAMRAESDAVLVGSGTAAEDNPELTCRIEGVSARPVRIVADSGARLSPASRLARTAGDHPTWLLVGPAASEERLKALQSVGVRAISVAAGPNGGLDLADALRTLGGEGLTRLLVEGGGRLAAGLLSARLVDRLAWFHAPAVLGSEARPAVAELGVESLAELLRFRQLSARRLGDDRLTLLAAPEAAGKP